MDYFLVYLWTRLDFLTVVSMLMMLIGGGLLFTFYVFTDDIIYKPVSLPFQTHEQDRQMTIDRIPARKELVRKVKKYLTISIVIGVLVWGLVPTKKDVLMIYLIPTIYNAEGIQDSLDILNKLPKALREYLSKELDYDI